MKNTMTLRQLRAILPSTKGIDTPSEIWVAEHPDQILFTTTMSDAVINVYRNGFYTYIKGGHTSILRVDGFSCIRVESQTDPVPPIGEEEFLDSPYYTILHDIGDQQWMCNAEKRNNYRHGFSLSGDSDDWCEGSSVASAEDEYLEREERREEHEWLREALKTLTKQQRKIVILFYYKKMTQDQIAKELGIRQQTVLDSLKRSINKMRKNKNNF